MKTHTQRLTYDRSVITPNRSLYVLLSLIEKQKQNGEKQLLTRSGQTDNSTTKLQRNNNGEKELLTQPGRTDSSTTEKERLTQPV